ncbi:hypothetical protein LUZ61_007547 [Rhynchospora tenuis]|uniref:glutathione transferase n=1 Tax=Rhynchospora tenuis TaxID=198213 RepID=A0AAD6EWJ8_9POAL|nr:hypothetical protein LUZ61_007547 [Rhynchospora tenuis]
MGGMKLYGSPISTCTARVLLCLEEVGAKYELVLVSTLTGEHTSPAHLARNPFGQIPALEDGDLVLFESRAISRYVLRKHIASGVDLLKEQNFAESALVDVWLEAEAQQYNPAIQPIIFQFFVVPKKLGVSPDQAIIDSSLEKLKKVLKVYVVRLSKSKYLGGDFFSWLISAISPIPNISWLHLMHRSLNRTRMLRVGGMILHQGRHLRKWLLSCSVLSKINS